MAVMRLGLLYVNFPKLLTFCNTHNTIKESFCLAVFNKGRIDIYHQPICRLHLPPLEVSHEYFASRSC